MRHKYNLVLATERSRELLEKAGFNQAEIESCVRSWQFGSFTEKYSHGFDRLPWLIEQVRRKKVNPDGAYPIKTTGNLVRLAGDWSLGYHAVDLLIESMIVEAPKWPIMMGVITNAYPTGCIGQYAMRLADEGYVSIFVSSSPARVAPHGGEKAVFPTLGHAIGLPGKTEHYIYDSSVGRTTNGELQLAATGATASFEWFDNRTVIDEETYSGLSDGSVKPDGLTIKVAGGDDGHKFSGLAGALSLLVAGLTEDIPGSYGNSTLILINPSLFAGEDNVRSWTQRLQAEIESSGSDVRFAGQSMQAKLKANMDATTVSVSESTKKLLDGILV